MRTVKEFGNGAHITLPTDWTGGVVETELIVPERPEIFDGIQVGSRITVDLSCDGRLYGMVQKIETHDQASEAQFVVQCSIEHGTPGDDSRASSSEDIRNVENVDMTDISEFHLVVSRYENEPWENEAYVMYYGYEYVERIADVRSRARRIEYSVSRTF